MFTCRSSTLRIVCPCLHTSHRFSMTSRTLYVLYSAQGSMLGHLKYAYYHIRGDSEFACAACDITHGKSLSLSELPAWQALKERFEKGQVGELGPVQVKQLHTDEQTKEVGPDGGVASHGLTTATCRQVRSFLRESSIEIPCVLLQTGDVVKLVMSKQDLQSCSGDQAKFEQMLPERAARL